MENKKFSLDNIDKTQPERLSHDATTQQRLEKFTKIVNKLNENGISLVGIQGNPVLADDSCGFKLTHNIISWEIFKVDEVVDMIVSARDRHIEEKPKYGI